MDTPVIIHGKVVNREFVPDQPLPDIEGPAELIVHAQSSRRSMFDVFGKAEQLRSGDSIDAQIREERAAWDAT